MVGFFFFCEFRFLSLKRRFIIMGQNVNLLWPLQTVWVFSHLLLTKILILKKSYSVRCHLPEALVIRASLEGTSQLCSNNHHYWIKGRKSFNIKCNKAIQVDLKKKKYFFQHKGDMWTAYFVLNWNELGRQKESLSKIYLWSTFFIL